MARNFVEYAILTIFIIFATSAAGTQQASPRDLFKQYLSELQRNPNDQALREKIIKLAQELKPPPAMPEDAERHMARGAAVIKSAKDAKDFNEAAAEFEKAALAAPWLADAYYNLGVAKDKAGDYAGAVGALKFYLLAGPEAQAAKEARSLIYEIEYRQERAAREASEKEAAELALKREEEKQRQRRNTAESLLRSLKSMFVGFYSPHVCAPAGLLSDQRCTWSQYQGRNWTSTWAGGRFNFVLTDNLEIEVYIGAGDKIPTANDFGKILIGSGGPPIENIKWSCYQQIYRDGKLVPLPSKPAWVDIAQDGSSLTYTCETSNDPSENPSGRYYFVNYRRCIGELRVVAEVIVCR